MYSPSNKSNNFQDNSPQIDIVTTIQILSQKISQLEDSNNNLSQLLNDEISQRQNLEKHSITSLDAFSGQLNILKNNYEKMEEVLIENISKMKEDIKSSNPGKNNKGMNNNYVEDIFKNEFVQCRNEINKNTQKIEILENQLNITNKEYQQNLNEINKKVDNCINELRLSKDFQKQTKLNFQTIREEFQRNLNNNQNFLNDVNSIIIDFKKNMDVYNSSYNKYTTELNKLHENLCLDRDNNNNRIDKVEKGINTYINERNQEWDISRTIY
jgi:hypothetical protein